MKNGQFIDTEKGGVGMKSGYGGNEHDQLLDVKQLDLEKGLSKPSNLEEGLTSHSYKADPWLILFLLKLEVKIFMQIYNAS